MPERCLAPLQNHLTRRANQEQDVIIEESEDAIRLCRALQTGVAGGFLIASPRSQ
jgi:hypothetical protein